MKRAQVPADAELTFKPKIHLYKKDRESVELQKDEIYMRTGPDEPLRRGDMLRSRSVEKDYKQIKESKEFWRQYEKNRLQKQRESECTFKPDLHKTAKMNEVAAHAFDGGNNNYFVTG